MFSFVLSIPVCELSTVCFPAFLFRQYEPEGMQQRNMRYKKTSSAKISCPRHSSTLGPKGPGLESENLRFAAAWVLWLSDSLIVPW